MAKKSKHKSTKSTPTTARVRKLPKYRSFRLSKKRFRQSTPVPGTLAILKQTFKLVIRNKKLFAGMTVIYIVLAFIFIYGFGESFNISETKQKIQDVLGTDQSLTTGVALFTYLVGSSGSGTGEGVAAYQFFLTIIISLATIWAARQLQAGETPRVRDTFYKGMYPLIPFIFVLLVIGLQLIPLLIGNLVYTTVVQNGLAVTAVEGLLWLLFFVLMALLSLYMLISSVFALYIVTLPNMTPLKSLRSARELVLHRRFSVSLRIVAMPLVFIVFGAIIFIPLLIFVTSLAQILFLLLTSLSLIVFHIYMYTLYRSLL